MSSARGRHAAGGPPGGTATADVVVRITRRRTTPQCPSRSRTTPRIFDLRHEDFNDPEFLYEVVFAHARQSSVRAHRLSVPQRARRRRLGRNDATTSATRSCGTGKRFSSNPSGDAAQQLPGDVVIALDPPRQQQLRKVLNPYFSPGRMKQLQPQIRAETDALINEFIEDGRGDLAAVAWQQPGIVFFKYVLGMPVGDVLAMHRVDGHRAQRGHRGDPHDGVGRAIPAHHQRGDDPNGGRVRKMT